jgi:hypothetical protein
VGAPKHSCRCGEVARRDRASDSRAADRGAAGSGLGNRVNLDPSGAAPTTNQRKRSGAILAEGGFRREDDAARTRSRYEAGQELLPGGRSHRAVEAEVEHLPHPHVREAQGSLDVVEKSKGKAATEQQVGMRFEPDMQPLQPRGRCKPQGSSEETLMTPMEPVEYSDRHHCSGGPE